MAEKSMRVPVSPVSASLVSASLAAMVLVSSACGGADATGGAGGVGSGTTQSATSTSSTAASGALPQGPVFLVLLENHNLADLKVSPSAPTFQSLLAMGAHAEAYTNPPTLHPSEPNYIWLEAGDTLGVKTDDDPDKNHLAETDHLVTQLEAAGHSWKSYQEDIDGVECPLSKTLKYVPRHNPMVYFDDVTNGNDPKSPRCIAHVRPYTELAADLAADTIADFNLLTPNLCHDMHDACPPSNDSIKNGDDWLAAEIPKLLASKAYARGAVVMIAFDEGLLSDGPIAFIALSKSAKSGYASMVPYTHSSTLKTIQEMFSLTPLLRHAADPDVNDLRDLFNAP